MPARQNDWVPACLPDRLRICLPDRLYVRLPDRLRACLQVYRTIKQASDSAMGIPSQCIVMEKAGLGRNARDKGDSARMQYVANVIMKMNVKLGGSNCV